MSLAIQMQLNNLGDPTDSSATAGLALRVTGIYKPLHHGNVQVPLEGYLNKP